MKWKDIKLGRKFFISFGLVVSLLIVVGVWAISGIGGIVDNAEEVIDGNKLRTEIEHKYVQHLLWISEVNKLLTDDEITSLNVQTDHTKCDFGKWYYGNGKEEAVKLAPELKTLFDNLEQPHKELHASAIKIKEVFKQADRKTSAQLRDIKAAHLIWMHNVKDALLGKQDRLDVITDHEACALGNWMHSDAVADMRRTDSQVDNLFARLDKPHEKLHESAIEIERLIRNNNFNAAFTYYKDITKPNADKTLDILEDIVLWNDNRLEGMNQANDIYTKETLNYITEIGALFDEIINKSKDYIMTDDVMINQANTTRRGVVLVSLFAILMAVLGAVVLSNGIVSVVKKAVAFAQRVAAGDLTQRLDLNQKDEIGVLADSLSTMCARLDDVMTNIVSGADSIATASQQMSSTSQSISQGANEQASSTEEVSSSMEEMSANIQQNTDNSKQTESISQKVLGSVRTGSDSADVSQQSMRDIAEKISIINDIAFQTNILALNAAVEAARAGDHGKGFAVVAAEVRKLAERSKVAADEINELSGAGVRVSEQAGDQLKQILPEVEKTVNLVQEIASASIEQSSGASQVNNAIQQLNTVTQQNAAASEELASGAEELAGQAEQLKELVSFFKIRRLQNSFASNREVKKMEKKNVVEEYDKYNPEEIVSKLKKQKINEDAGLNLHMYETNENDKDFENF